MPLCFIEPQEAIRVVAESVGREARRQLLGEVVLAAGRPPPRGPADRGGLQGRGRLRGRRERGAGSHDRSSVALPGAPYGACRRGGRAVLLGPARLRQLTSRLQTFVWRRPRSLACWSTRRFLRPSQTRFSTAGAKHAGGVRRGRNASA